MLVSTDTVLEVRATAGVLIGAVVRVHSGALLGPSDNTWFSSHGPLMMKLFHNCHITLTHTLLLPLTNLVALSIKVHLASNNVTVIVEESSLVIIK